MYLGVRYNISYATNASFKSYLEYRGSNAMIRLTHTHIPLELQGVLANNMAMT
jgi:hypothetical protein